MFLFTGMYMYLHTNNLLIDFDKYLKYMYNYVNSLYIEKFKYPMGRMVSH